MEYLFESFTGGGPFSNKRLSRKPGQVVLNSDLLRVALCASRGWSSPVVTVGVSLRSPGEARPRPWRSLPPCTPLTLPGC